MKLFIIGSIKIDSKWRKKLFRYNLLSLEPISSLIFWNFNIDGKYAKFSRREIMKRYNDVNITVDGERGIENHAVIAMIAKAFIKQNPFEVWGTGEQIRNWTYVGDIINGTILAAEKIDDGTAINLGTMERTRVIDAVKEVMRYTGHNAEIKLLPDMPTGPYNRVADNSLAKKLLNWEPEMKFINSLRQTIDWYFSCKNVEEVKRDFEQKLTER